MKTMIMFFLVELGILILKPNKVSHVVHVISQVCQQHLGRGVRVLVFIIQSMNPYSGIHDKFITFLSDSKVQSNVTLSLDRT